MEEPAFNFFKQNICRICLSVISNLDKLYIFSEECFYQKDTLIFVLKELTPIRIHISDSLPKNICLKCSEKVKEMIIFKRSMEDSTKMLHYTLKKAHTKFIIEQSKLGNANFDNILERVLNSMVVIDPNYDTIQETVCNVPLLKNATPPIRKTFNGKHFIEDLLNNQKQRTTKLNQDIVPVGILLDHETENTIVSEPVYSCANEDDVSVERHPSEGIVTGLEKRLTCTKCDKAFSKYSFLQRHLLYHSLNIEVAQTLPLPKVPNQPVTLGCNAPQKPITLLELPDQSITSVTEPLPFSKRVVQSTQRVYVGPKKSITQTIPPSEVVDQPDPGIITQSVHSYSLIQCKYCEERLCEYDVRHHMRQRHMDELKKQRRQQFTCAICKATWLNKCFLKRHMKTHEKNFKCELCELTFKTLVILRHHKFKVHRVFDSYLCHICGKLCSSRDRFKSHVSTHVPKLIKCPIENCYVKLKYRSSVRLHINRIHGTQRDFICEYCGKGFISKADLRSHIGRHSNILKHKCQLCGRRYRHPGQLKQHIMIQHQRLKPYKCPECPQLFSYKYGVTAHCTKFHPHHPLARPSFKVYKQTTYKDKLFKCTLCRTKLASEPNLRNHYVKCHREHVLSNEVERAQSNL